MVAIITHVTFVDGGVHVERFNDDVCREEKKKKKKREREKERKKERKKEEEEEEELSTSTLIAGTAEITFPSFNSL